MDTNRVGGVEPLRISAPKIDFYTATVKCRAGKGATMAHAERLFLEDVGNYWGGAFAHITSFQDLTPCEKTTRYQIGLMDTLTGVKFGIGGDTETIRLEATGIVCDKLRSMSYADGSTTLDKILSFEGQNPTRLDIALDFNYPIPPYFVCETRLPTRIKGERYDVSETGWTFYIGSFSSDRLCRIYLYQSPHPRCNNTRVEYQLRDTYADAGRKAISGVGGLGSLSKRLSNTFGIQIVSELQDASDYGTFRASSSKSPNPQTLRWAWDTVYPALVRLVREGDFSIELFADAIRKAASE